MDVLVCVCVFTTKILATSSSDICEHTCVTQSVQNEIDRNSTPSTNLFACFTVALVFFFSYCSPASSNMEMFLHNIPMKFEAENHFPMGAYLCGCVSLAKACTSGGTSIYTFKNRHTSIYSTPSLFFSGFIFAE